MDDDPRDDPRDEQIEALRREAAAAGDDAQERLCTDALRGNQAARRACAAVFAEVWAQQDPPARECECTCGCEEPATGTDDGGNPSCDECADYYCDADGQPVCSRVQDDRTCRHCGEAISWGHIQTGSPGTANHAEGTCGCSEWTRTERGPGNWVLGEGGPHGDD